MPFKQVNLRFTVRRTRKLYYLLTTCLSLVWNLLDGLAGREVTHISLQASLDAVRACDTKQGWLPPEVP